MGRPMTDDDHPYVRWFPPVYQCELRPGGLWCQRGPTFQHGPASGSRPEGAGKGNAAELRLTVSLTKRLDAAIRKRVAADAAEILEQDWRGEHRIEVHGEDGAGTIEVRVSLLGGPRSAENGDAFEKRVEALRAALSERLPPERVLTSAWPAGGRSRSQAQYGPEPGPTGRA